MAKNNFDPAADRELTERINRELRVRSLPKNMPSGPVAAKTPAFIEDVAPSQASNPKKVGWIIITVGVLLIGAVMYLGFVFIIKPAATPRAVTPAVKDSEPVVQKSSTTTPVKAGASPLAVTAPAPLIIDNNSSSTVATSSISAASSSEPVEASSGLDANDLPPILDGDNDGLSDEEEEALGTDSALSDSDKDSYPDLSELRNGYNPAGNGSLSADTKLDTYNNLSAKYSLLYPKLWGIKSLNEDHALIITAPDSSVIQAADQENPGNKTILSWYESAFPDDQVSYDRLSSLNGWDGIYSADGLNLYLTGGAKDRVYIISYIPASEGRIAYKNIFSLVINSFKLSK